MSDPEQHDVEVEITFLTTEEGGRRGPARTGYRPQFYYEGQDWDAVHTYRDRNWVYPGETVTGYLDFLSPDEHLGRVFPGMTFQIREGRRTIARGRIIRILALPASAKQMAERRRRDSAG